MQRNFQILLDNIIDDHKSSTCDQIAVSLNGAMLSSAVSSSPLFGTGLFKKQSEPYNGKGSYRTKEIPYYSKTLKFDKDSSTWRVKL